MIRQYEASALELLLVPALGSEVASKVAGEAVSAR
jgi:hypothetical protein